MKKIIATVLCALVLVGSAAGVSYANEEIKDRPERERVFTYGKFINKFTKSFDENEYPIITEIKDVIEDNKEIMEDSKELREQLTTMLKQAKEEGTQLSEEAKQMIKTVRESIKANKEALTEKKEDLEENFNFEDLKDKIQESKENESVFNDIATRLLSGLNSFNDKLENRYDVLESLVETVENDID